MQSAITRRQQAQRFNTVIDQALLAPSLQPQQQLLQLTNTIPVRQLAERIRKRATLLGKRQRGDTRQLLAGRDELIMTLYASTVPQGWACAWCDGSSIKLDSQYQAGIGGILTDSNGSVIARISRAIGDHHAYEAELMAVTAIISTALEHQQQRLWVFTDNHGLAQLWQEHRDDNRLAEIRRLVSDLDRFALQALPRQHNQPANALAKMATAHVR
jgi:ribonuclease HI